MTMVTYENEWISHVHLTLFDKCVQILENSGLIDLALTVVISEALQQHLK